MSDPAGDSTIGEQPTESGLGPEELGETTDDVSDDGTAGDGTLGDGTLSDGTLEGDADVLDEMLANHGTGGWSDPGAEAPSGDDALDAPATGDDEVEQQPVELDGDAMGRPVSGSMNDDDQGMENAGGNLGA